MKLSQAVQMHAAALRRRDRSARTIDFYATWLTSLSDTTGSPEVETVTLAQLREWVDSLYARKLAPGTIRGAALTAKVFFNWCEREGIVTSSPAKRLELPAVKKRTPDVLTTNDVLTLTNDLARHSRNPKRDIALIVAWAETGCRSGEILSLTTESVHPADRYAVVEGKGKQLRWVYFGEATEDTMTEWLAARNDQPGNLFQVTRDGIRQILRRLTARTGIKLHPHKLRRSAATLRAARGMSAPALQAMFGWSNLSTAERYVAAARTREQAAATAPLDGARFR
jgi:site-specific recombinase XerD